MKEYEIESLKKMQKAMEKKAAVNKIEPEIKKPKTKYTKFKGTIHKIGKKYDKAGKWIGKNINPDLLSMDADLFDMKSTKPKTNKPKNRGKTKYIIKHGKAYPVAKPMKKKKEKRSSDDGWIDLFGGDLF